MSTKTLRKRIALVAVSALGFGVLSVAPSQAAAPVTVTVVPASSIVTVSGTTSTSVNIALTAAAATATTTYTVTPTVTSAPNGSAMAVGAPAAATVGLQAPAAPTTPFGTTAAGITVPSFAGGVATLTPAADTPAIANVVFGKLTFAADFPGVYVITLTPTAATTATAATVTFIVTPTTTTGSAITATQTTASGVVGVGNTITLARTAPGVVTDGQILGQFTTSADYTTAPLTTVHGKVAGALTVVTAGATALAPTFVVSRTAMAVGSYTMRFWVDTNSNGAYESTETSTTVTFTVAGALSTISVSLSAPTRSNVTGHQAFTVTATVADSLGGASSAANLYVSETGSTGIVAAVAASDLTDIVNGTALARVGTTSTYVGTFAVNATGATLLKNLTYVTVSDAVDITALTTKVGTATLTVVGFAALDATTAISANSAVGIGTVTSGVKQSVKAAGGVAGVAGTVSFSAEPAIASITFTGKAAALEAGKYIYASVTPAAATTCVTAAGAYVLVLADLSFTYTVTKTCLDTESYTVLFTSLAGTTNASATVTFAEVLPTITVSPAAYTTIYGSTNTLVATLADQYGRPLASKAVSAAVTGRNVASTALTTDAAGKVTWTATDASASTLLLTDTVTFTYNYTGVAATNVAITGSRVITYAATAVAVGSIVTVDNNAANSQAIDQVESTPGVVASTTYTTYTATLKTAAGAPVAAGVLVTFAGGADDLFLGSKVGVTTSAGQATVLVYRHKTGYASITATANGVSSLAAGDVEWVNVLADARNVTIKAEPASVVSAGTSTITATVTDRWGNPVSGVTVTFGEIGAGRISLPAVTNLAGISAVDFTSNAGETGTNSVTASFTGGQSADIAGYVTSGGVTTAVAGVTAGNKTISTTMTVTKDTSTSTADALLALAQALGTRDQASATVDAAAEATDAANAATDAANAAAEAADAATAAAQDASDAVAALSAQVSEAIAGLKKQLVSLTNLVIKIQKKVKA